MPQFIAFLRAINVGGHTVKMDRLRELFESLGYKGVETFIASGNVIFESRSMKIRSHEQKIERVLREGLGYEVATIIRTLPELIEISNHKPFPQSEIESASVYGIAFMSEPMDDLSKKKLIALRSDLDEFHVREREIYWMSRMKQGESTISNAVFEKIVGRPSTLRGANTVSRLVAKYSR